MPAQSMVHHCSWPFQMTPSGIVDYTGAIDHRLSKQIWCPTRWVSFGTEGEPKTSCPALLAEKLDGLTSKLGCLLLKVAALAGMSFYFELLLRCTMAIDTQYIHKYVRQHHG